MQAVPPVCIEEGEIMGKLSYSDWVFIENALLYFSIHETRIMEKNQNVYSGEEISLFRSSVQDLIDKVSRIREGE